MVLSAAWHSVWLQRRTQAKAQSTFIFLVRAISWYTGGFRHTRKFRRRARKRPDNMAAHCRDQRSVSEGGATMRIITWSPALRACVSVTRSRSRMRFHNWGWVAVGLALWFLFNTAGFNQGCHQHPPKLRLANSFQHLVRTPASSELVEKEAASSLTFIQCCDIQ